MRLHELRKRLTEGGIAEADVEARLLLCHFGGYTPASLLSENPDVSSPALQEAVTRRLSREPLAYILGETAFFGETYTVSPACLIPRFDTEVLVEKAIELLPPQAYFADLCTGSGCIAVSLLCHRPDCRGVGVDISADALRIAAQNAQRNGVADRLSFYEADLLRDMPADAPFDAILANPPYIRREVMDSLSPEVKHEPQKALVGGEDGLVFYESFIRRFRGLLKPHGFFLFEIGYDQGEDLRRLAREAGMACDVLRDYASLDRVAFLHG